MFPPVEGVVPDSAVVNSEERKDPRTRSARAKEILGRFGEIEWFRSPTERHPLHGNLQVAFLGWRFTHPDEALEDVFREAVRSAPARTDWAFRTGKNWMITPTRLVEQSGPNAENFNDVVALISKNDQAFCADTSADLDRILTALERASGELPADTD